MGPAHHAALTGWMDCRTDVLPPRVGISTRAPEVDQADPVSQTDHRDP